MQQIEPPKENQDDAFNSDSDGDSDIFDHNVQIRLPRHLKCTCHTMNLIATTDVNNIKHRQFSKLKRQLDTKLSAIWNKQSRSSQASDFIKKSLGELFVIHNATRWNSYYNALCKVKSFIYKKNHQLQATFDHFKIKKLTSVRGKEFLKEFIKVMKPISEALDVFQNKEKMSVGCVLPVLTLLKEKIADLKQDRSIVHCVPLVTCLSENTKRRFDPLLDDDNLRLAAITDPNFKLSWIPEERKITDTALLKKEIIFKKA